MKQLGNKQLCFCGHWKSVCVPSAPSLAAKFCILQGKSANLQGKSPQIPKNHPKTPNLGGLGWVLAELSPAGSVERQGENSSPKVHQLLENSALEDFPSGQGMLLTLP